MKLENFFDFRLRPLYFQNETLHKSSLVSLVSPSFLPIHFSKICVIVNIKRAKLDPTDRTTYTEISHALNFRRIIHFFHLFKIYVTFELFILSKSPIFVFFNFKV